jgi:ERCC4-type nuclease
MVMDTRPLAVGDFAWVLKATVDDITEEFVMDYVIERKAASDFESSHFSNHLRDQVYRLKSAEIDHIYLLIEGAVDPKFRPAILEFEFIH